ncbi:MAG: ATP-binding cassette domain-containing protein [Firmicutes bacterium]|nr:ATP-binding cassette domain-containing protein [Bacillota bacterium]
MTQEPLLRLDNVTKQFRTRQGTMTAVDRVSFTLVRGEHLGIVGASGSGKSTVIKLVQRLIQPTSGDIFFTGVDIARMPRAELRKWRSKMQAVSQNPYASLFPNKTIGQNIVEPLLIHRIGSTQERKEKAMALMEKVGVPRNQFYAFPHEISGGQQQRIAIARALALQPELLILDEAVSSLDVSIQAQILHLLASLRGEFDLTYLFVSHNLAVVRLICSHVAVMFLGRIVEMGPIDAIYEKPAHPYTKALLAAVPEFTQGEEEAQVAAASEPPTPYDLPSGCVYRTLCPLASDRCASEQPALQALAGGRLAACHFAQV